MAALPTTAFVPSVKPLHKHILGLQNITVQSASIPRKSLIICVTNYKCQFFFLFRLRINDRVKMQVLLLHFGQKMYLSS